MIRSTGIAWWSWKGVWITGRDLRTWAPLALVGIARFAILLFLVFFHHHRWVDVGLPLVEFFGGPAASHYPDHLLLLPQTFQGLDPWILLLAGSVAAVAVTRSLAVRLGGLPRARLGGGGRQTLDVMLVVLLLVALDAAVRSLFGFVPDALRESGGKLELALELLRSGTLVLVTSPFICAIALIVVRDESAWSAMQRSIRIASANPITVLLFTALPVFASVPFQVASGAFGRGRLEAMPEAMVLVIAARIFVELVTAHITLTATTRVALWNASEE